MRRSQHLLTLAIVLLTTTAASAQEATPPAAGADSRLLFGATARSLPAGHGYFSLLEIGMPFVQVGVTDRFSLGVGTPLPAPGRMLLFTPKYEFYRGTSTSVAAGMAHFAIFGIGGVNVVYGVATQVAANGSFTGGVGVITGFGDGERGSTVVGMIGGERRISERVAVLTENYVLPEGGAAILSVAVRLSSRGRFSSDLGVMSVVASGFVAPGPVINLNWSF